MNVEDMEEEGKRAKTLDHFCPPPYTPLSPQSLNSS